MLLASQKSDLGRRRLRIGAICVDALTFDQALGEIEQLIEAKLGGAVFTPNVDHVVIAESNSALRDAYEHADLSLADGMPLVWASRVLGCPLPERVAGSDVFVPLMELAARKAWRVYLVGGTPGVAEAAAARLRDDLDVNVVGWISPVIAHDGSDLEGDSIQQARTASADLIVVALGNPKQELWIRRAGDTLRPAVALGLGAVLDFLVGQQQRAPRWIARSGFEWLYRLARHPRRLWRRYLVRDPRFALIVLASWWSIQTARVMKRTSVSSS
jgi:N-acetylglucosaminyldiphosphoundecaprenol N-acetyl-beta-D-mannosaminyltransferase